MKLFRGYVPTKNKKCTMKFKDNAELLTLSEAKKYSEYAGILAEDTVLIDVDDEEQSNILMDMIEDMQIECKVLKTTRGRHFYFRNNGAVSKCYTGTKLVCGLTADIKAGCKNSYAVLKFGGKTRFCEWDKEGEEYSSLPRWLYPVDTKLNLLNMNEGDGRNQALFDYILTLNSMGFSKAEARDCIKVINEHIFETPLTDKEIDTICRDDAFPKDVFFDKKNGFLHEKFGEYLINEHHIKRIDGTLCIYRHGEYVNGEQFIENSMLRYIPSITARQRTEVMKYLNVKLVDNSPSSDPKYIGFKNGVLNIESGELVEQTSEFIIRNQIRFNYDPEAYCKLTDKTLDKLACGDKQIRKILEESIGYGMYRRNELSKAFILTGEKANGKSTFLDTLLYLYGEENVSNLDIAELDERFSVAELSGKLVNIGDDISDEFLQGRNISTFKKIVSGNSLKAEFKGENVFFFKPYCKLFFSANEIPRTKDKTGAVLRRLVIIPFNARFTPDDPDYDPYITTKLKSKESIEYLIRIGIEGLKRVLGNKDFTVAEKVTEAVKTYEIENNPILFFIKEVGLADIVNQNTDNVYKRYRVFCLENGFGEMSKIGFSRELSRKAGLSTKVIKIDNRTHRVYTKVI